MNFLVPLLFHFFPVAAFVKTTPSRVVAMAAESVGAEGDAAKRSQSTWTDWAYPDEGAKSFEEGSSFWERNYVQDENMGAPNALLNTTLSVPETVPNDAVIGVVTYDDAYWKEYNARMKAYQEDLVINNNSELFAFSIRNISKNEAKATAVGTNSSSYANAGETGDSDMEVLTTEQEVNATETAVAEDSQMLSTGYGSADGVDNSTLLQAYWDDGDCGHGIDDQNRHWCSEDLPPQCEKRVSVGHDVCKSESADLVSVRGRGWGFGQALNIDGCKYAFFAQYKCVPVPMEGAVTGPSV